MKKIFFCIAMLAIACVAVGQTKPTKVAEGKTTQVVKVDNKTFKATNSKKSSGDYKPTGFYYQLKSGEKREIYIHTKTRGEHKSQQACYIKNPKGGWREINVKPEDLK